MFLFYEGLNLRVCFRAGVFDAIQEVLLLMVVKIDNIVEFTQISSPVKESQQCRTYLTHHGLEKERPVRFSIPGEVSDVICENQVVRFDELIPASEVEDKPKLRQHDLWLPGVDGFLYVDYTQKNGQVTYRKR